MKYLNIGILLLISVLFFAYSKIYAQDVFVDIQHSSYRDSINILGARNIISWYGDGVFKPDQSITRAELLKIVMWAAGRNTDQNMDCFDDVSSGSWYAPYICSAKVAGIIWGYGDGSFKPDQPITIAEAIKMGLRSFDIGVSEWVGRNWYWPYFEYVHDRDIFSKYSIRQDALMKRGMMAYMAQKLLEQKETGVQKDHNNRSPWCGLTPPATTPTSSVVWWVTRHYLTTIWSDYDKDTPIKLIIAFHGRTNSNTQVRSYYNIDKISQWDAIILYPSGLPEQWPSRNRSDGGDKSYDLRDFALFDQLVKEFGEKYCIDKDQIYVMGHSLGAWFTNTLACARGDVIRGIWSVAGGITTNECSGPTTAILMHNPDDNLTPFSQWIKARDTILKQNSCSSTTRPVWPSLSNCVEYTECQPWASVIRCPHEIDDPWGYYYPHGRPKFVTPAIWDFFKKQS